MFWSRDKEDKHDSECWRSRFERPDHHHYHHHHHHHHYHQEGPPGMMARLWERKHCHSQEKAAEAATENKRCYGFFRNGKSKSIEPEASKEANIKSEEPEIKVKVEVEEKKGWFWS